MKHQQYLRSCVSDGALDMNSCLQWAQTGAVNSALAKTQGLPFEGWTCSPLDESILNTPMDGLYQKSRENVSKINICRLPYIRTRDRNVYLLSPAGDLDMQGN